MNNDTPQPDQPDANQNPAQAVDPILQRTTEQIAKNRKNAKWFWLIFAAIMFFTFGFTVLSGQQSIGHDFIDRPGWWRLGAFIRLGFFLEFAGGIFGFVWFIVHNWHNGMATLSGWIKGVTLFVTFVMGVVGIVFTTFSVRAVFALVSSPVHYTGSCTVSYAYYGSAQHSGHIQYYLKIPHRHNGMVISRDDYKTLSGAAAYNGTLYKIGNQSTPEYPCMHTVDMQYVSAEDTIIHLKILQ